MFRCFKSNYNISLQCHPISPRGHRKSQETTLRQARTNHRQRKERQKQSRALQFVEAKIGKAQVVGAALKKPPQGGAALNICKRIEGSANSQCDEQVDAEADGGHARTKQPETLAETLAFRGLDAARGPQGCDEILECQEEQRRCYK